MLASSQHEITISGDNLLYWDHAVVEESALPQILGRLGARKESVLIKADRRSSLGTLARVCDLARQKGLASVHIATD